MDINILYLMPKEISENFETETANEDFTEISMPENEFVIADTDVKHLV